MGRTLFTATLALAAANELLPVRNCLLVRAGNCDLTGARRHGNRRCVCAAGPTLADGRIHSGTVVNAVPVVAVTGVATHVTCAPLSSYVSDTRPLYHMFSGLASANVIGNKSIVWVT